MKLIKASIISAATLLMINSSFAQDAGQTKPNDASAERSNDDGGRMGRLDKNNDGAIDKSEFTSVDQLKAADANGDGTLSRDEIQAMVLKRMAERRTERMSRRLDIDGDGKVTLDEVGQQKGKRFALLDRNNDGKLEKSEMRHGKHGGKKHFHRKHGGEHKHGGNHKRHDGKEGGKSTNL